MAQKHRARITILGVVAALVSLTPAPAQELASPRLGPTFVENKGQFEPDAALVLSGERFRVAVAADAFSLRVSRPRGEERVEGVNLRFALEAADSAARVEGRDAEGRFHYFLGDDPARWVRDAQGYRAARIASPWPGVAVDLALREGALEYDLLLAPHADPNSIVLRCEGSDGIALDADGALRIATPLGGLRQAPPRTFAVGADGSRRPIECRFRLLDRERFGFELGAQGADAIVIDPTLHFATYLGGAGVETFSYWETFPRTDLARDATGACYVAGSTSSLADFPTTPGAFQTSATAGFWGAAYVSKLAPAGDALVWSTFLGTQSMAAGIAVDAQGRPIVVGASINGNFPITPGAVQSVWGGSTDAFVTRLDATGSALLYSTFLGGNGLDLGEDVVADAQGGATIAGMTGSAGFPTTPGAFDSTVSLTDAFVVKLDAGGQLLAGTVLGGTHDERQPVLAIDGAGSVVIAGKTDGVGFPVTPLAFDTSEVPGWEGFVSKLDPTLGTLQASTLLGGVSLSGGGYTYQSIAGLAVDDAGSPYVTGLTFAQDFPVTPGSFGSPPYPGYGDGFVSKLDATLSTLVWSGYLGGVGSDEGRAIAVGADHAPIVISFSQSPNFPITADALMPDPVSVSALTRIAADGSAIRYSTWLPGMSAQSIAIDAQSICYLTGMASLENFPATPGAYDSTFAGGNNDAFVMKLDPICSGAFTAFGAGCPGTGGIVPALAGQGCPEPGNPIRLEIERTKGGASGLLLLGIGTGALPLPGGACAVQIAPLVPVMIPFPLFGVGEGNGKFTLLAALPPGTPSASAMLQALILDPGAIGGIAATNALTMQVGT